MISSNITIFKRIVTVKFMKNEKVKKIQELRRSNSATPHDQRPNRERTRGSVKKKEIERSSEEK
jgi:hypothetical protein